MRNSSNTHIAFFDFNSLVSQTKTIYYVGGACSSGKTYQTCSYIREHCKTINFLYVAPSNQLAEQTVKELRRRGLNVCVINSASHPKTVRREIIKAMKEAPEYGLVLVVTWQAYVGLPYFPEEKHFQVIIDEIPQLDKFYPIRLLPENIGHISEWLDIASFENESVGVVAPRDREKLQRYLEKQSDDVKDVFTEFLKDAASPNKGVFVDLRSWNRVIENWKKGKTYKENTVYFIAILRPRFLRNSIMLGANFEDSLLYYWFQKRYGIQFQEFKDISQHLRLVETGNRDIEICYFVEGFFSKSKGRKSLGDEGTLVEIMDEAAVSYFGDEEFLYVANNDRNSPILEGAPKGRRISVCSHGLNCYDRYHNIYFSAALNRQPQHFKMLENLGFDVGHVHSATAHEVAYQASMRLSLRRPDLTDPIKILVPDKYTAVRVGELLGVKEVSKIGDINLHSHEPLSPGQRNQRAKTKRLIHAILAPEQLHSPLTGEKRNQIGAKKIQCANNSNKCFVTLHWNEFASKLEDFVEQEFDWQDWIKFLRRYSKNPVKKKKGEVPLFNAAIFDPSINPKSGYRTQDNFCFSSMLILDCDNGNLSPEKFEDIFWHKAGKGLKRSFIICNSFSRSPEQPNRFRVMFLYRRPAISIAEHRAVLDSIIARLESEGFSEEETGLDRQCKSGVQSFYMPCTNRAHPDYALFRTHGTKSRDIERYGIDPSTYWKTAKPEKIRRPKAFIAGDIPQSLSPELEKLKSTLMGMKENRHALFFDFASKLASLFKGERSLVEKHLKDVADTDARMRRKVKDALKSLERYGRI